MRNNNRISSLFLVILLALSINMFSPGVNATGISIDAGLTPAEGRWIFRSQVRIMERDNDPSEALPDMKSYMYPLVAAYGLRSDIAVMVRQGIMRREMTMMNNSVSNSGFGDLLLLGKFRLLRINTPKYTLGIAPTLGLEMPTGQDNFTSDTWDLLTGCFVSGRMGSLGMDLNLSYVWNGMVKSGDDVDPGDEFSLEGALAYQFSFGESAEYALAPVIESSYKKTTSTSIGGETMDNSGESLMLLSPGLKFTWSSFVIESLVQFPVWQKQEGLQTEFTRTFLLGLRLMR